MSYEKHPEYFERTNAIPRWKAKAVARADHVICISEHTRRDLLDSCVISEDRVSVTHLGYDDLAALVPKESPDAFRHRVLGSDQPYLLYVGSRAGCKNFGGLIHAYSASPWLKDNFGVLCFGGGEFSTMEHSLLRQEGVMERVHHVSGSDTLLASCYSHAALFVYPSLYEGFGIPPLEAMSLDCPVACSNTSSIPEVVGDAAVTFNPAEPDAIRAAVETALGSPSVRLALIERGRRRKDMFSWRRCARETLEAYKKVLSA